MEVSSIVLAFILGAFAALIGMGLLMVRLKRGFQKQLESRTKVGEEKIDKRDKQIDRLTGKIARQYDALDQVIRSSPNSIAYRIEPSWDDDDEYFSLDLFVDDLISKKKDEEINTKTEDRDSRLAGLFNKKNGGTK